MDKRYVKSPPEWRYIVPYLLVGFIGFCINMIILTVAIWEGVDVHLSILMGISASLITCFILDRYYVFEGGKHHKISLQFVCFIFVCFLGACINFGCAVGLLRLFTWITPHGAALVGIIIGTTFNYIIFRTLIFKEMYK